MTENHTYLVIADDEVRGKFHKHEDAQQYAQRFSLGRYPVVKVFYLPNMTMQGHWFKGERLR